MKVADLFDAAPSEGSASVRARVVSARDRQRDRRTGGASAAVLNADLLDAEASKAAGLGPSELAFYRRVAQAAALSARGARRLLRVSRTIADLEGAERVGELHLSEAVAFRMPEETASPARG